MARQSQRRIGQGRRAGRGRPANQGSVISSYAMQRRIDLVGLRHANDPRAGCMLGCYLLRGYISERQYNAGECLARLWVRWRHMAQIKDGFSRRASGRSPGGDIPRKEWLKVKDRMTSLNPIIAGNRDLVTLVVYGIWVDPSPAFLCRLTKALDQIADIFRLRVLPAA